MGSFKMPNTWQKIINSEIGNMNLTETYEYDIRIAIMELANLLQKNIESGVKYQGVINTLTNSIAPMVWSKNRGSVYISAVRPSIYSDIGIYGNADLALVYDKSVQLDPNTIYFNKRTGKHIKIGKIPGFSHNAGNYLEKTAREFMASHPGCTVFINE